MDRQQHTITPDLLVVGGGMVGAALALGAAQQGLSVTVLEQHEPELWSAELPPQVRVSAISVASVALLQRLGVWPQIQAMRTCPYRHLETWEWEGAQTRFSAQELNLPELGHIVENCVVQLALWQALQAHPKVTLLCESEGFTLTREDNRWRLTLADGRQWLPCLLAGADGAQSRVRAQAGIGLSGWQYRQSCLLVTVKTAAPQQDTTWQRFYPSGPRAFLPLYGQHGSLVWYDKPARIKQLSALPNAQLHKAISQAFPARLGEFEVLDKGAFALVRRHAQQYVLPGLALLGDAAHTINPLAGQGVNLGFKDVQALLEVLDSAVSHQEEISSLAVLHRYECRRRPDNLLMQSGMDLFYGLFSNDLPPLRMLRNVGLMVADKSGVLKRQALRYALGL